MSRLRPLSPARGLFPGRRRGEGSAGGRPPTTGGGSAEPGPLVLENRILALADVQGACERIRTSPIPLSYTLHLKRILFFYLPTLPFGFVHDLAWYSIPAVMLVFFMLVGIEAIGEEIEDPFGTDLNDLPFDDVLEEIKRDVKELMGED